MNFNEYDVRCKMPFGAVRTGEPVMFRIAPKTFCESAMLSVYADGQGKPTLFPMNRTETGFEIVHSFETAGLYFYGFALFDDMGGIQSRMDGEPGAARSGGYFQITVFAGDYVQPDGWTGGIMYQIFPDRFAIGGGICDTSFDDRILHADTNEQPAYLPDSTGRVRNNDYFGGNLAGIEEKLPYLHSLGVRSVYLNPICEAHSNHRYDTADYMRVDPLLGDDADFVSLCEAAHKQGIRIILDGVFSHTGADSVYFNRTGRYDSIGAWQSKESEYAAWYTFTEFPDRYNSWWGFDTLPEINEMEPTFLKFICGERGVIDHWLSLGADGFRLDVADELPDVFIAEIRKAIKRRGSDKILIGEVWEDASNKVSYGVRRRYLLGDELDSAMNYPFRTAILDFVREGDAERFMKRVGVINNHYPKPMLDLMMNMLSTHDTERALTVLAIGDITGKDREWQATRVLTHDEYLRGIEMLKLAMVLQFTLPGIPCIYYGDEIGMQGMRDPFNRGFMRWNEVNEDLLAFTKQLALLRSAHSAFADGELIPLLGSGSAVAFLRRNRNETMFVALNRADTEQKVYLPDNSEYIIEPWKFEICPFQPSL